MARKRRFRRNDNDYEFTAADIERMRGTLYKEADKLSKAMDKPYKIAHSIAVGFHGGPPQLEKKANRLWDILSRAWSLIDRIRDSS